MSEGAADSSAAARATRSALEVPGAIGLRLTCFGGPIGHIGYSRDEYVHRRSWVDDPTYADLVAFY